MKRPSLKRSKKPAPPQQAAAPKPPRKRRLRRALSWPLRMLAKPFVKLGGLRGRARLIVWGLLVVIAVIAALQLRGGPDDQKLVREALVRYAKASRDKDYQTLCDQLLASSYVKQTASSGLPCEVALRTALQDVRNPTLTVLSIEVSGDRAAARVHGTAAGQVPGDATYTLIREGDSWRILPPRAGEAVP
ncbi:MAG: hypothetical protein QOJ35_3410 [Solirubrobacteraceae bacterium]|nr:hypothetical protein [Solirubrobacteraceae bacterium]